MLRLPIWKPISVCQKSAYACPKTELATKMDPMVQKMRMAPDACSLARKSTKSAVSLIRTARSLLTG